MDDDFERRRELTEREEALGPSGGPPSPLTLSFIFIGEEEWGMCFRGEGERKRQEERGEER